MKPSLLVLGLRFLTRSIRTWPFLGLISNGLYYTLTSLRNFKLDQMGLLNWEDEGRHLLMLKSHPMEMLNQLVTP